MHINYLFLRGKYVSLFSISILSIKLRKAFPFKIQMCSVNSSASKCNDNSELAGD